MTPADLAAFLGRVGEVRARCEKATKGPWEADGTGAWSVCSERVVMPDGRISANWIADCDLQDGPDVEEENENNACHIAAARTDLPAALDAVEALVGLIGRMLDTSIGLGDGESFTTAAWVLGR